MMGFSFRYSLLLLLSCFFIFSNSQPLDTLTPGQSIKDGQTLLSAGAVFELGFFSPGNSLSRYVGIWYRKTAQQSVIWVANRESPLSKPTGNLTFGVDGNLAVRDEGGNVLWSTNSSILSNASTVKLFDSGNLKIQSSDGTTVSWQSFDHPTDTFIPGMKVILDRKTGRNQLLTSWKSPNDPSMGNYSLGLDPRGSPQIFIWEGKNPRWRSGDWNGETFIGAIMRPLYIYGFKLTNNGDQGTMFFTFTAFNTSLLRFRLQWDGVENTTMLVEENKEWESVWLQPNNECQIYGKCGEYAICSDDDTPTCSCLYGFEPKSSEDWSRGNWSSGCMRRTPLMKCELNSSSSNSSSSSSSSGESGEGDGFFKMESVKLPDLSDWGTTVLNEADCRKSCLNNCSCKAYSYVFGIGCMIWSRDLIDILQFHDGRSGNDLNIKLAGSELDSNTETWKIAVILSSLGVFILIICILLWWKCNARLKDWWKKGRKHEPLTCSLRFSREVKPSSDFSGPSESGEGQEGKSSELPMFSFDYLATVTNNFSDSNKLGQGGFGHVYKGTLPGGEEVAVKRLSTSSGQGLEEFRNEVILIAKLQHRNLVRLLGYCIQEEEKILIYEYMPNKSLDAFLFDPTKQMLIDWPKRFDIIEGIARGLLYLHRDSRLRIVHRDLKTSNILLDEGMNPKISDFGMARIFGGDDLNQANTNRVVGTYGYMSPEYAMEGLFSVKSDVYSFGILVLEIVTGKRCNSFHRIEGFMNIVGYAWKVWNEDRAMELIDSSIQSTCSTPQVLRCVHVALLCLQDRANDRPDISSVVRMLGSETAPSSMPKLPKFTLGESPKGTNNHDIFSTNDVTITRLQGR